MSFYLNAAKLMVTDPALALARACQKYIHYYNNFSYEFEKNGESRLISKLARTNPKVVFDVGANIGSWALLANRKFSNAIIHCFEISSETFETLARRCDGPSFVINNIGLSCEAGAIQFKLYKDASIANTILIDASYADTVCAPTIQTANVQRGDTYAAHNGIEFIDFLKIDVEGAENLVLEGFSDLLSKRSIRVIQFEYGYNNGDAKFLMKDFYRFFDNYGYYVAKIRNAPIIFREWKYTDNDFTSGPNYVAVRKDDAEVISLLSSVDSV